MFNLLDDHNDAHTEMIPLLDESEDSPIECQDNDILPLLPLRNMILFPKVVMPITVGRKKSLRLVREVYQKEGELFVGTQINAKVENPALQDIYPMGTVARIVRILEMPDGTTTVILQGKKRATATELISETPFHTVRINIMDETEPAADDRVFTALVEALKELAIRIIKNSNSIPDEATFAIRNIEKPISLINFICSNFSISLSDKVKLLELNDLTERGYLLLDILTKESQLLEIKASIQNKARLDIDQQQREYYLQQQMKTIQEELGGDTASQDVQALKEKAKSKKWDNKVRETFEREIRKLERMHPNSPDFSVQLNYVETIVNLPWNEFTKDNFDLKKAQKVLDRDHFGMEKVKDRIIEHLAVLKLKGDLKSPIICLYGPPGVGKTSLGKSIAETLGRKYVRVSLGGLHDEAEIRGHRRTYIGAMPGRIIQNLNKCGSSNPVFVLDEIDKVNSDFKGDPASALLEVLDPEQNNAFHDNFLDIDYDLSNILFIATANDLNTISKPLLDRMELIEVSGYITEEKIEIATRHLIPKQLEIHGIKKNQLKFTKPAVKAIVDNYTRESGVRSLDRTIAKIMRKAAKNIAIDPEFTATIKPQDLQEYLGVSHIDHDMYDISEYCGVVTGLAWTQVGGEILYIESSINTQKGGKLSLTGNLGDVMKESAQLALEYIKSHNTQLGISDEALENHSVHIHVPEGAIPKDGPSAGIAILTALVSSFTGKKVKNRLAMTGEITLRGKLLPVGGIKEKILAAKRAGIKEIILCVDNQKDVNEIQQEYLDGLQFHFVRNMADALTIAIEK
ncbi:MAG: endopeptidase La [Paludibacteraceae bacterium]|nr:endopeptidase La [Paludibacteraceae bacterium]